MSLLEKIKKNSTIKESSVLKDSIYCNNKDMITTPVPSLNIALSGKVDGGFSPGIHMFCGESKRFKCFGGETVLHVFEKEEEENLHQ